MTKAVTVVVTGGLLFWRGELRRACRKLLRGRVEGEGHGRTPLRNHAVEWRRSKSHTGRRDDRHLEGKRQFGRHYLVHRLDDQDNEGGQSIYQISVPQGQIAAHGASKHLGRRKDQVNDSHGRWRDGDCAGQKLK
jgi:hypothetical protein